jgi:hypothetical protein
MLLCAPLTYSPPGLFGCLFLVGAVSELADAFPRDHPRSFAPKYKSKPMAKPSKANPARRKHALDSDDNEAGPSRVRPESPGAQDAFSELEDNGSENGAQDRSVRSDVGEEEEPEGDLDGFGDGMVLEGFSGPNEKVVKPLTPEALAAFKAAKEKMGVIYISRIPPGMRPTKVRHLMSQYGEVGKVYLQQEGEHATTSFPVRSVSFGASAFQTQRGRISDVNIRRRKNLTLLRDGSSSRIKKSLDRLQPC